MMQAVLEDGLGTPSSLVCLTRLQRCYLANPHVLAQAALPLPAGPWLHNLRCCLGGNIGAFLSSAGLLSAAHALEFVEVAGSEGDVVDWHSQAAAAFFGWLLLRGVLFCPLLDSKVFESWAFTILLAELWQRRPALGVHCIVFDGIGVHPQASLSLVAGKD